jgi:hypothetical protein
MQLFLQQPLQVNHEAGYIVETPITVQPPGSDDYDWLGSFYDVFTTPPIIFDAAGSVEYSPSERYLFQPPETTFSADSLDIEIGLFTVPDSPIFDNALLCPSLNVVPNPTPPVFTTNNWENWKVDPALQIEVGQCSLTKYPDGECVDIFDVPRNEFNVECIVEMPPTYQFEFVEVNNKRVNIRTNHSLLKDGTTQQ